MSHGNVFLFLFLFFLIWWHSSEVLRWGTVYFIFSISCARAVDITIDLAVDRGIYVRRHGQNNDPKE